MTNLITKNKAYLNFYGIVLVGYVEDRPADSTNQTTFVTFDISISPKQRVISKKSNINYSISQNE